MRTVQGVRCTFLPIFTGSSLELALPFIYAY
jgi:hypothetical protein